MEKTTESKIAETILQKTKLVQIGGDTYEVAPPTLATLILLSEQVSLLPKIEITKDPNILTETLRIAKDCRFIGDTIAILILGAKGLYETKTVDKKRFFGFVSKKEEIKVNKQRALASLLLNNKSPKELNKLFVELIERMEIGSFFGLTTSLIETNMIKPTREVETIVSGQQ